MYLNPQICRFYYSSWNEKCGNPPTSTTLLLGHEGVCKICSIWPLEGSVLTAVPKTGEILVVREGAEKCNVVLHCGAFFSQRQHANTVWAKWLQKRCYSPFSASDLKKWLAAPQLLSKPKENRNSRGHHKGAFNSRSSVTFYFFPYLSQRAWVVLRCWIIYFQDFLYPWSSGDNLLSVKMFLWRSTSVLKRTLHKTAVTECEREFNDASKRQVKNTT